MNKTLPILSAIILILVVECAPPALDTNEIRPLVKEFLVALSRHDTASARARSTDSFFASIGGEEGLKSVMDCYASFLKPNLFEFESPQPDGNAYLIHAYLHDGKGDMLPMDIRVVAGDPGWKVDRIIWHKPVHEG